MKYIEEKFVCSPGWRQTCTRVVLVMNSSIIETVSEVRFLRCSESRFPRFWSTLCFSEIVQIVLDTMVPYPWTNYQFPRPRDRSVNLAGNEGRTRVSPSIYSIESVQARKSCATWRNESCPMLSAFCGLGLFPLYWNIRPQHYGNYQGNGMSASGSHEGAEGGLRGRGRSGKRGRPCVETDSCRSPIHTHHPNILHSEKLCHISMKKHRYSHWQ